MKNSRIIKLKSKFFAYRALTYSSFLLLPVWAQKSLSLSMPYQLLILILYTLFMAGQWFLLGKEIDHRLKIYFRVNSSIDRLVYRLLLGMITFILYFQVLSFLPVETRKYFFWATWVVLGLFYSWPTRGKIIEETASKQLTEFKFLDSFEKTILGLTLILFIVSIPQIPPLENIEALKLFFDPMERFGLQFWNFLSVNYLPFEKFPELYRLSWFLHFYIVGIGLFLLSFYALLRFFVSRRLSLLGAFALISSWSFSKIIGQNVGLSISSTYSLIWIWGFLWSTKSSTYRAGLFVGLLGYWGTIIDPFNIFLLPIQLILLYFFSLKEKTFWFKRQIIKYSLLGIFLSILTFIMKEEPLDSLYTFQLSSYFDQIIKILNRKAFFSLSLIGLILFIFLLFQKRVSFLRPLHFDILRIYELAISIGVLVIYSMIFGTFLIQDFAIMWIVTFLGLIPLEWIFQSISRLRSRRNLIYVIYILICLLDSHFEGRVKILIKLISD